MHPVVVCVAAARPVLILQVDLVDRQALRRGVRLDVGGRPHLAGAHLLVLVKQEDGHAGGAGSSSTWGRAVARITLGVCQVTDAPGSGALVHDGGAGRLTDELIGVVVAAVRPAGRPVMARRGTCSSLRRI